MDTIRACLFWLDDEPWRHWTLAWLCFWLTGLLAMVSFIAPTPGALHRKRWFVLSVAMALFAFRWPTWFFQLDLNPDEAQIVSGALTLDRFLLPWKHLDPTTHGPLCEYGLIFAAWTGAPFNYVTARILAALLQAGSLVAVWATLRQLTSEVAARLAILPGLAFWCLTSWDDFLHYSSELPGVFLMAWGGCFLTRALTRTEDTAHPAFAAFLTGVSLGAVPYGKLQSVPQAGLIGLIGLILMWRLPVAGPTRRRLVGWLLVGAISPSLLHGLYLTVYGQWSQFWFTYLVSALDFLATSAYRLTDMPGRFLHLSATSASFGWFLWGNLGFCLLYLRAPRQSDRLRLAIILGSALLAIAWFTVLRPGRESAHYLHLLVIPLTTLAGLILGNALANSAPTSTSGRQSQWPVLAAFALLGLGPQILNHTVTHHRFVGHARHHWAAPASDAARYLLAHAAPGDTLAMWGWAPHLLVETGLPHGTREAQSGNQIMQWPLTPFYVNRYLNDLERRQPAWFVDAVGPGAFIFADRVQHAHESVPELQRLIARDYELQTEIDHMRIYRRNPFALVQRETVD